MTEEKLKRKIIDASILLWESYVDTILERGHIMIANHYENVLFKSKTKLRPFNAPALVDIINKELMIELLNIDKDQLND